jgi:3-methyladenine DNA glycosylase/8-oxoguanine DNA glycosylase
MESPSCLPTASTSRGRVLEHAKGRLRIEGVAGRVGVRARDELAKTVSHMFRLDEDLSDFYELVNEDELAWCALGAGRMLRAPTVFEDVVKTICTLIQTAVPGLRPALRSPSPG